MLLPSLSLHRIPVSAFRPRPYSFHLLFDRHHLPPVSLSTSPLPCPSPIPLPHLVHLLYIMPHTYHSVSIQSCSCSSASAVSFPAPSLLTILPTSGASLSTVCGHIIVPFVLSTPFLTITLCPPPLPCLTILPQFATLPYPLPLHSVPHPSGCRCTESRLFPQVAVAKPHRAVVLTSHPSVFANFHLVPFSHVSLCILLLASHRVSIPALQVSEP